MSRNLFKSVVPQKSLLAAAVADISTGMAKEKKKPKPLMEGPRRADDTDSNKLPQNFRFTTETIRKLEKAAREYGMSKTNYTELALKDRFKKDRIE